MAGSVQVATIEEQRSTIRSTRRRWNRRGLRLALYVYLSIGALLVLIPYLWMVSASLKQPGEIFQVGVNFLPRTFYTDNYRVLFGDYQIVRWLLNSFVVAGIVLFTNMTFTVTAGYAFARLRFKGRDALFFIYVGAMMVPLQVRLIPSFIIVKNLGWLDTYQGIASIQLIEFFGIFLIRQFMLNFPRELEDSARIDGCNWFRVLWQIILPNSKPALAALAIFTFTAAWTNFLWALVVINRPDWMTIQVGLSSMKGEIIPWGVLMAGTFVSALPLAILYVLLQRLFVQGIVTTGIKG